MAPSEWEKWRGDVQFAVVGVSLLVGVGLAFGVCVLCVAVAERLVR